MLQEAVAVQDRFNYGEPRPRLVLPRGCSAGAALLMNGDPGPERNPRNQRSLLRLKEALKPQHRDYDASLRRQTVQRGTQGREQSAARGRIRLAEIAQISSSHAQEHPWPWS